jgi:hypothetical protein
MGDVEGLKNNCYWTDRKRTGARDWREQRGIEPMRAHVFLADDHLDRNPRG